MTKKKKSDQKKPAVHDELDGMNVQINSFGEVISNIDIDKINKFLDENVEDKKLQEKAEKEKKKDKKTKK